MFALRLALIVIALMTSNFCNAADSYTVKRRDNLTQIAKTHQVAWEAMLFANEAFLKQKYEEVCDRLSDDFRNRSAKDAKKAKKKKGSKHQKNVRGPKSGGKYFCNDRYSRPYGNTLQPGWVLKIPSVTAPSEIQDTVANIKGQRIALVIDDTGSMENKRAKVAGFYLAALHQRKTITGVYLYADGAVRKYEAGGVRDLEGVLRTRGNRENTLGALLQAAQDHPDLIILVTDEKGDDWGDWSKVQRLPPIIAHCLPLSHGWEEFGCRTNLKRLVATVPGSLYIEGIRERI